MLKRHLAPETLKRLLHNELMSDAQEEKKPPRSPCSISCLAGAGRRGTSNDGAHPREQVLNILMSVLLAVLFLLWK